MAQLDGLTSLHTRVERWECDHNDHWNTRFYARSFADASDALRGRYSLPHEQLWPCNRLHLRFHRELNVLDFINIRSARFAASDVDEKAENKDIAVHFLQSRGGLAATALDFSLSCDSLPPVSAQQVSAALPRSLHHSPQWPVRLPDSDDRVQLGPLRTSDISERGCVRPETLVRHCAIATTCFLDARGLSYSALTEHKQSFMAVELTLDYAEGMVPGEVLISHTRLIESRHNSLTFEHCLATPDGQVVALIRLVQLCVNTETRKVSSMAFNISTGHKDD